MTEEDDTLGDATKGDAKAKVKTVKEVEEREKVQKNR